MGSVSILHWLILLVPVFGLGIIGLAIFMASRKRK